MKIKKTFFHLIVLSLMFQVMTGCARAQEPCSSGSNDYYFGVEISGMLCGYSIAKECTGSMDGKEIRYESNEAVIKLSVLGEGVDIKLYSISGQDVVTGRLLLNETMITTGNSTLVSKTRISGDTAWHTANNSLEPRKILLSPEVILETTLKSPHLLQDFIHTRLNEKKYTVYEPIRGEIIEKGYIKKGEEDIILKDLTIQTLVLEETDYSNGTRATIWLNRNDAMTVKTVIAGRNIYLTDKTVIGRIAKVNYDNLIFARVNKVIPDFLKVNYMKVRAKIESLGEVLTPEKLNFPGQKFTGAVTDNLIDGIFELEPKRYDGANAPPFPPDLIKHPELTKYLEPEMAIESNDPVLIDEAKRITDGAQDSWEAAKRLSKWVAHNIEGAIPGGGSAINTYKMREGECGSHSRLLTAFCRAVGIPARLSTGCMYLTRYGGSFGAHAWTEIYMGEAGWVAVDATAFEIDYVDAGHIRLGEHAIFQPKEMEILEYRHESGETSFGDSVPLQYKPYLGKYTDLDRNRIFKILYRDKGLAIDIPQQLIMPLDEPDSTGQWYPKITREISISFKQNSFGQVEKLVIRQKSGFSKLSGPDSIPADIPQDIKKYLGVYSLPQGKTRELSFSGGSLLMYDPTGRSQNILKFSNNGEMWKETTGMFEFRFETDKNNEVSRMILYVTFLFPKGEPAVDIIEPVILESGIETGLKKYEELKANNRGEYLFTEGLMNTLGYRLLSKDKMVEAIGIFQYNAKENPESFNVYDSLGEAYMKNGEKDLAIENYKKSIELNPKNENGKKILEKLESGE